MMPDRLWKKTDKKKKGEGHCWSFLLAETIN